MEGDMFYHLIAEHYGDQTAKRSGVRYMDHIDEGIRVLKEIGATKNAQRAYCIHPIVQDDQALLQFSESGLIAACYSDPHVWVLAMEYRSIANEYLSKHIIADISEIRLSPLKEVNDMLIADKVQNRADFELYHLGRHERSMELDRYFKLWLERLGVNEERYKELVKVMKCQTVSNADSADASLKK